MYDTFLLFVRDDTPYGRQFTAEHELMYDPRGMSTRLVESVRCQKPPLVRQSDDTISFLLRSS